MSNHKVGIKNKNNFQWDFESLLAVDKKLTQLVGMGPSEKKLALELHKRLFALISNFKNSRKIEHLTPRGSAKAKVVRQAIVAIDAFQNAAMSMPQDVLEDLFWLKPEPRALDSILKRSIHKFSDCGLSYPLQLDVNTGKGLKVSRRFSLSDGGKDPLWAHRRLHARLRAALRALDSQYSSEVSRRGKTRNAEKRLLEGLFLLFDQFYIGDSPPVQHPKGKSEFDNDYINSMAEFADLAMRIAGAVAPSLGTNLKETLYNGKLGRAARTHCYDKLFFINRQMRREDLKEQLKS